MKGDKEIERIHGKYNEREVEQYIMQKTVRINIISAGNKWIYKEKL